MGKAFVHFVLLEKGMFLKDCKLFWHVLVIGRRTFYVYQQNGSESVKEIQEGLLQHYRGAIRCSFASCEHLRCINRTAKPNGYI